MAKRIGYTGSVLSEHPFEVNLKYTKWPLLFSDQWFLPKLQLTIKNLGKTIQRGSVEVYIADFDKFESLASISSYQGPFQDVYRYDVTEFLPGREEKRTFVVESKFLREGRYIVRVVFLEWIPSDAPMRELEESLKNLKIPDESKDVVKKLSATFFQEGGINPWQIPTGQFKGKQMFDLRFVDVLKIQSLEKVATIMGAFIGSVLATFATFIYVAIRLIFENWDLITKFFERK